MAIALNGSVNIGVEMSRSIFLVVLAAGEVQRLGKLQDDRLPRLRRRRADEWQRLMAEFVVELYAPCFLLYEAETLDAVRAAALVVKLPFERITEAVTAPTLAGRQE